MNKADIDRICASVDLYKALQHPIKTWSPFGIGGSGGISNLVNVLNSIIDAEFSRRRLSLSHKDLNYFFEFSILPSVLDPVRPGKLACFSYLWGDNVFSDIFTIKPGTKLSLYEQEIADMLKTDKISVFHHPNFLFDIRTGGTDPVTITYVPYKGSRKVLTKTAREKAIMMPRSFSETIQMSKDYYSLPPTSFKTLYDVQDALHKSLVSKITDTEDSYFISFPIIGATSSNQLPQNIVRKTSTSTTFPTQGIGSFFLYIEGNCITPAIVSDLSEKLYVSIGDIGRLYAVNYLFNLGLQLQENARREAIKSAKAAIMSRNMSHNLGSHVMFYIKQRLESVEKILQTGTLQYLVKSNSIEGIKEKIRDASTQPGEEMPFLVGLGRFINYLQERQDYIATVATDYIPYKTSISFKDAIYDELKPDLRAQRHNSDKTVKGKQPANLLLDYIAYSEGFHPSKCIKLKFGNNFDGTSQNVPDDLRKLNIALPSGNLGRQAFFSIMENIIRNTAKHDGVTNENKGILGFQFDILDGSQLNNMNFIAIAEDSEKEIPKNEMLKRLNCYGDKQNKENYYYIGITANTDSSLKDINGVLRKIQDGLIDLYIENNSQMRDEYKGIKEMRISSAWMRGYGIDTDIPLNEPPAIAVRDNGGRIQYIVCLPKPKKIAFVASILGQIKDEQMPEGIKLFKTMPEPEQNGNTTEDAKSVKRFVKDNGIADYELIVCTKEDSKRLTLYVGSRIYTCDETEITDLVQSVQNDERRQEDDKVNAIGDIYIKWLEQKFKFQQGVKLPKLIINDGQAYENHISDTNGSREKKVELGDDRILFNSGDSESDQLIYSKHYNPKEHRFYDNAPFVEGISGGNSTDRLLRQDEWTKEWYVKHMTAALTKVAIFDERIYSNFIRKSTFIGWDEEKLKKWMEEQKDRLKSDNPQRSLWIEMRKSISTVKKEEIGMLLIKTDEGYAFTKDEATLTSFLRLLPQNIPADCSVADLYRRKGVWAFNIEVEKKEKGKKYVIIKGYTKENGQKEIARIAKRADDQTIVMDVDDDFQKKFHFITIHQGILDKIYSALEIRKEEKNEVTDELFAKFSINEKEGEYLPQFIIHSGRSKPNNADMPQKQPFIQFAALDHAVKDCKYTLSELLYSAHYES